MPCAIAGFAAGGPPHDPSTMQLDRPHPLPHIRERIGSIRHTQINPPNMISAEDGATETARLQVEAG